MSTPGAATSMWSPHNQKAEDESANRRDESGAEADNIFCVSGEVMSGQNVPQKYTAEDSA
jgi:hypothetical protein